MSDIYTQEELEAVIVARLEHCEEEKARAYRHGLRTMAAFNPAHLPGCESESVCTCGLGPLLKEASNV